MVGAFQVNVMFPRRTGRPLSVTLQRSLLLCLNCLTHVDRRVPIHLRCLVMPGNFLHSPTRVALPSGLSAPRAWYHFPNHPSSIHLTKASPGEWRRQSSSQWGWRRCSPCLDDTEWSQLQLRMEDSVPETFGGCQISQPHPCNKLGVMTSMYDAFVSSILWINHDFKKPSEIYNAGENPKNIKFICNCRSRRKLYFSGNSLVHYGVGASWLLPILIDIGWFEGVARTHPIPGRSKLCDETELLLGNLSTGSPKAAKACIKRRSAAWIGGFLLIMTPTLEAASPRSLRWSWWRWRGRRARGAGRPRFLGDEGGS